MGRFQISSYQQVETGWKETLIDQMHEGSIIPLLSNSISNELAFDKDNKNEEEEEEDIVAAWARYIEYPWTQRESLYRLAQFRSIMAQANRKNDGNTIKRFYLAFLDEVIQSIADPHLKAALNQDVNRNQLTLSQKAERLARPSFSKDKPNALLLLADLPIPIYLTTSYHRFLEAALENAGKRPHTGVYGWNPHLKHLPTGFEKNPEPTPEEPLVYHLHGFDHYPSSLVLTEDDQLDFLLHIFPDKQDAALNYIREKLSFSSVLMLGYSLQEWDFRVIFRGLVKPETILNHRTKSVFAQVVDDPHERTYVENYLQSETNFSVVWKNTFDCIYELWQEWKAS